MGPCLNFYFAACCSKSPQYLLVHDLPGFTSRAEVPSPPKYGMGAFTKTHTTEMKRQLLETLSERGFVGGRIRSKEIAWRGRQHDGSDGVLLALTQYGQKQGDMPILRCSELPILRYSEIPYDVRRPLRSSLIARCSLSCRSLPIPRSLVARARGVWQYRNVGISEDGHIARPECRNTGILQYLTVR